MFPMLSQYLHFPLGRLLFSCGNITDRSAVGLQNTLKLGIEIKLLKVTSKENLATKLCLLLMLRGGDGNEKINEGNGN